MRVRSVLAAVLSLSLAAFTTAQTAANNGTAPTPTPAANNTTKCDVDLNDLVALNYALTLEHLESAFYRDYQAKFSAQDFIAANFTQEIYDRFTLIAAHEKAHVDAITATITNHGGQPVPECQYAFGVTDVRSYVSTAQLLENTGVSAYDGAINSISDPGLQQIAATIATVEARHAAFLNELNNASPFPDALDTAKAPADIVAAVTPLIKSCPYTLQAPVVRPGGVKFTEDAQMPLPSMSSKPARGTYTSEQLANDLVALNYALTLEHLEATFYEQALKAFDVEAFRVAGFAANVRDNYVLIGAHEMAHVSALQSLITARGGTPVSACTYAFDLSSVELVLRTSQALENTGVSAYDGAVNSIADTGLQTIAATVATVEARHAAFINKLLYSVPFPADFDTATSPDDIVKAVTPFITKCDYELRTPKVANKTECADETQGASGSNGGGAESGSNGGGATDGSSGSNGGVDGGAGTPPPPPPPPASGGQDTPADPTTPPTVGTGGDNNGNGNGDSNGAAATLTAQSLSAVVATIAAVLAMQA